MDTRKIGGFLKRLRKGKGLTQEQLAEILLVSSKTVSRWETGTNLPDLSILIQMAEFYDVEITEILDGERKGESMDNALMETLCRVADYHKLEKERTLKIGNAAFAVIFSACSAVLMIQLIAVAPLSAVLGETIAMVIGGATYIGMALHHGLWEQGAFSRETLIGILCSIGASIAYTLRSVRLGIPFSRAVRTAPLFFLGIALLGFVLMKALAWISRRSRAKREKL